MSFVLALLTVIVAILLFFWWWDWRQEGMAWNEWLVATAKVLLATIAAGVLAGMIRADFGYAAAIVVPVVAAWRSWKRQAPSLSRLRRLATYLSLSGVLLAAGGIVVVVESIDHVRRYTAGSWFGAIILLSAGSGLLVLASRGPTRVCGFFAAVLATITSIAALVAM